ncbi:hypothetical protein CDL15_Pgr001216 [Punica granatum]|uniref:Cytochrome P450 n=1 Tax=Punica granatum TaxID=22663 RepID=A0A218WM58_PUNGR|nr:hypothetical protein CDL15_Pgr001216 [Punica granatum]
MDDFFVQFLLLISSCLILLLLYVYKSNASSITTNGGPLIGNLLDFIKNRNRFIDWTTEILSASPTNTMLLHRPGIPPLVLTADPSNVKHILMTNFDCYPKGKRFTSHFGDLFGQVMFVLDGERWKDQRRIAAHEFGSNTLRDFGLDIVAQETHTRLIPILESASKTNHVVDLQEIFNSIMFNVFYKLAFDERPGSLSNDRNGSTTLLTAFKQSSFISHERLHHLLPFMWKVKKFLTIGSEQRLRDSINIVHKHLERVIQVKFIETRGMSKVDVMSRFNNHGYTSIESLRDIGIGLMLAGMDTTVSSLTWFFWLLSSNPRVEKQIVEEVKAVRAKHNRSFGEMPTYEEIREMHYLHAAMTESMRLYPPAPFNVKACISDDVLPDGTQVKKGWTVLFSPYAMGRMEKIWGKDCLEYKPERWLEDGLFRQESPFRYPIFHAGPRMCLGKDMAYIQMKSIAALMIERFVIEARDNRMCPEKALSLTLIMKGGLPVKVRERYPEFKD